MQRLEALHDQRAGSDLVARSNGAFRHESDLLEGALPDDVGAADHELAVGHHVVDLTPSLSFLVIGRRVIYYVSNRLKFR